MRRFSISFLLLAFLCCPTYLIADSVRPEKAANIAGAFFSKGIKTKSGSSSVKLVWTYPEVATKSAGDDPLLYVFEREGGGFAIVAGEDAAHPILGYSETERFETDNMPEHVRSFFNWYGEVLDYARQNHLKPDDSVQAEWSAPESISSETEGIVQLETAKWGQWSPFNDLCPVIDGERCPTGCVPTAIAIIMRYHKWPEKGHGHLPSYDYPRINSGSGITYSNHIDGYDLGHTYDWDNMPMGAPKYWDNTIQDVVRIDYSSYQSQQVARLLYDVGVACTTSYTPNVSGSDIGVMLRFTEYFDYDREMSELSRSVSTLDWERTIRDEIDDLRPVLYSGHPEEGIGHAMVIDGYRNRFFSVNFGWNGNENGFYLLTPIDNQVSNLPEYYSYQSIVHHIHPKQEDKKPILSLFSAFNIHPQSDAFYNDYMCNPGFLLKIPEYLYGNILEYSVGHFDKSGKLLELICDSQIDTLSSPHYMFAGYDGKISRQISDGDMIRPCYRWVGTTDWLFPQAGSGDKNYIRFNRDQSLSELVFFGFSSQYNDDEISILFPNEIHFDYNLKSVYAQIYHCIIWRLEKEKGDSDWGLAWGFGQDFMVNKNKMKKEQVQFHHILDSEDGYIRFWLEPGDYLLKLLYFDEEMVIHFKI